MSCDRGRLAADIAWALAERSEQLVTHLEGAAPTSRSRDELRYRASGALSVIVTGLKRGIWCDFAAGGIGGDALDFVRHKQGGSVADALKWSTSWLGLAAGNPPPAPKCAPFRDDAPGKHRNLDLARTLFRESVPAAGTPAETYLASRGCALPCGDTIRFHPRCPRERGERLPAMVSAMTDAATNEFVGVHRTFLSRDGRGKAEAGKAKMMLGGSGIVRLARDEDITYGVGLCEGIETGLALISQVGWSAIWAAGCASSIAKFPVLPGVDCLTIFPDADDSGAGAAAADTCGGRWVGAGREVQVIWPPAGRDWNDALRCAA